MLVYLLAFILFDYYLFVYIVFFYFFKWVVMYCENTILSLHPRSVIFTQIAFKCFFYIFYYFICIINIFFSYDIINICIIIYKIFR